MRFLRFALPGSLVIVMPACGSTNALTSSDGPATPVSTSTSEAAGQTSVPEAVSTDSPAAAPSASNASDPPPSTTEAPPVGNGELPFGLRRCDAEFSVIPAEPSYDRDEPVYVGNDKPSDEVRAWAQRQPGFEEMWIDCDDNGWLADDPVCFDGVDPEDAVIDGPQPTEGDGWRLLTVERTGESYRTRVATDDAQYAALWDLSGVTADRSDVDFKTEIVIWFGAVNGSCCELRMDQVVFDLERSIVHGDFVVPGNLGACTSDANPGAYLVAVERTALPLGPFSVQLSDMCVLAATGDGPFAAPVRHFHLGFSLMVTASPPSPEMRIIAADRRVRGRQP